MHLGKRIKEKRINLGWTQEELGKMLGVSKVSICQWEKGVKNPSTDNLIKLANVLNVTIEYLIGNDVSVLEKDSNMIYKLAKEELDIIKEIRKHKDFYELLLDNPKRALELVDKKLF